MESESKLEVKEGQKNPEVKQDSGAIENNHQSTSGYDQDFSNDCLTNVFENHKNESAISSPTSKAPEKPAVFEQNMESMNERELSCTEEPPEFMDTSEWRNMNYSEKIIHFRQGGVPPEEAVAIMAEVRQETGITDLSEQHARTASTNQHKKISESYEDTQKATQIDSKSTVEVTKASDITSKSADQLQADDETAECDDDLSSGCSDSDPTEDIQAIGKLPSDYVSGTAFSPKWVRHPECKHSEEELKKMAGQIQTKTNRQRFLYLTYCRGLHPDEKLKIFLSIDANKPRVELRKMSKILPKKLRTEFYCKAMKGKNPHGLMRKYMSWPANQQWLLCNKLKLSSNKILFKLFQLPGQMSDSNAPAARPLKDWFNIFLQEGSVDEAIDEVKKLILRGAVTERNTSQQEIDPNTIPSTIESANPSVDKASADIAKFTNTGKKGLQVPAGFRILGKKSRSRRSKKFQQLNEDQRKVYNSWLEQGLSHQDALTIVLRFPGGRKPISSQKNLCAWGKCVEHPKTKFSVPPKTNGNVAGGQSGVSGTQPSSPLGSEPAQFKKPIFDRIPVPSTVVDTSGPCGVPVTAGMSLAGQQNSLSVCDTNDGISNTPAVPHGLVLQVSSGISPLAVPSPTLAMGSQGPRVPQRSTFVEEPNTHLLRSSGMRPDRDSSSSADALHLCIVPPAYPNERLSDEEMDAVENSIHIAISGISDKRMKPIFKRSYRNEGKYEMICQDLLAKKWLHKYVSCMYPVVPLKIIPGEPAKTRASAVLPLCKSDDADKILKFISHDELQTSSNSNSGESGAKQDSTASCKRSQADEHALLSQFSVGHRQGEKVPIPVAKRKPQIYEPSQSFSCESKGRVGPSRHHRPKTVQNPRGQYEPHYSSQRYSQENSGQYGYNDPAEYVFPSSSKQNVQERLIPNVGLRGRLESGFCRHLEQGGMSWHGMNQRRYNPSFLDYGPSRYIQPSQHGRPLSNGFFLERPRLVHSTEKRITRSPTPDYDELLKSARSRLNLPGEPADTPKHSHTQVRCWQATHVESRSVERAHDRSCNRSDPPQRIPVSGALIERNRSTLGSPCWSRSEPQKRSPSSPPPPKLTKSSRWD